MERTEHPRHVPHRRSLDPAFGQGAGRLPFEIDEHEFLSGVEHLAEMVIAVDPDPHRRDLPVEDSLEPLQDPLLHFQHLPPRLAKGFRQGPIRFRSREKVWAVRFRIDWYRDRW